MRDKIDGIGVGARGDLFKEIFEVRADPVNRGFIGGVVENGVSGRPAVEEGNALEAEIVGELGGATGCVFKGNVVAVDEDEGFLLGGSVNAGRKVAIEVGFGRGSDGKQDDIAAGILAELQLPKFW